LQWLPSPSQGLNSITARIETGLSGMLWEEKREKRALCPVERFDAPQRPDKPAPKEWDEKARWRGRPLAG